MQNDWLYHSLLVHQLAELRVHQGAKEKLFKNAVGAESLSDVSLES